MKIAKSKFNFVSHLESLETNLILKIRIQKLDFFFQVENTSPSSISVNSNLPAELKVFTTYKIPTSLPCTFDLF